MHRFPVRSAAAGSPTQRELSLGGAIYILYLGPDEWIHRRVESVEFVDAWSLRRAVSLDISIPDETLIGYESLEVLPLSLLEKDVLVDFDLLGNSGEALPLLTRKENTHIAWSTLVAAAHFHLTEAMSTDSVDLEPALLDDLQTLAGGDGKVAREVLGRLANHDGSSDQIAILGSDSGFMRLAHDLAANFLLLTPNEWEPGERRLFKFSYTTTVEARSDRSWQRFAGQMGWTPTQFDFDVPSAGESESYHFEFTAPPELAVWNIESVVFDGDELWSRKGKIAGNKAHAYMPETSVNSDAVVSLWLWATRSGLLRSGLVTAALCAGVLFFFLFIAGLPATPVDASTPILLAIPGLVSAFIVRPGEHRLATDLLLGIRLQIGVAGAAAYLSALLVVGDVSHRMLRIGWWVLSLVAGACFLSLSVAYYGIQRRRSLISGSSDSDDGREPHGEES